MSAVERCTIHVYIRLVYRLSVSQRCRKKTKANIKEEEWLEVWNLDPSTEKQQTHI